MPRTRFLVAGAVALYVAACEGACPGPIKPPPAGAVVCGSDKDCLDSQHCGYEGIDRPFICLDGPPDDPIVAKRRDGGR